MKRNKLFFAVCMAGSLALLASSCKKNEENKEVTISLPQLEEEADFDGSKLYIDFNQNNTYKWNGNDEVMFYNLDAEDGTQTLKAIYATTAAAEGATSAIFTGDDLGSKKDHFFAFYPVSKIVNGTNALDQDNFETFSVDSVQQYTLIKGKPTVDPSAMAAACETESVKALTLKHIFGVLRLKLKGVKTVQKLVLIDNTHNLSGNVTLKLHEVNMTTFSNLMNAYASDYPENGLTPEDLAAYLQQLGYSSEPEGKKMVLDCGNGVALSETTQTHFFFVLRPGALIDGFKVNVYFTDGSNDAIEYPNHNPAQCIKAGVIKSCGPTKILGQATQGN
jgi:hypothetical protein